MQRSLPIAVLIIVAGCACSPAGDAPKPTWWSLRPISRPSLPRLSDDDAARALTPIDTFILAKLRENGLTPAPEAERRTLIRRLYFDLIGLPPSPEDADAFAADPDPLAYEKLVDRLLASPHYGERWGRHWLDVVHYGDTHGYDKDKPRPNAWPYRDYVIRAFNGDRPYARFIEEQLAGDVLYPGTTDGIEALGFIAAGPWDFIGHVELPESKIDGKIARHLDRDDMVANTMNTFASTTVQCAQCHNHKFDPITQEDYYSLQAVFAALDRADKRYYSDPVVGRRAGELQARQREAAARKQKLDAEIVRLGSGAVPEETRKSLTEATAALADIERELAKLPPALVVYAGTVHHGSGDFKGTGPSGAKPRPIYVLKRGDVTKPGEEVGPGALSALKQLEARFDIAKDRPEGERRAALAHWLTDAKNPLTWRSIVNRLWRYHFGRGIVETPNDFGHMGQQPSHPELLDWLAAEFRDNGQSIKALQRLIVTSAVYRQSSAYSGKNARIDADNAYLWRMQRRRLEAEAVRDGILLVSGQLDTRMFGPAYQDFVIEKPDHSPHYEYQLHDPDDPRTHRRSVYRFLVRSQQQPFMTVLDCADPSMQVDRRNETISPVQALALLNNGLVMSMSKHLATRAEGMADDVSGRVKAAFRLALARDPTADEVEALTQYAQKHGLANTCRVILNLNEFVFVD